MGRAGKKSQRGQGEIYSEPKDRQVILSMTQTGKAYLDQLSALAGLSRSELIEQLARNSLDLHQLALNLSHIHTKKP
jgi:uncharacterized protein YidB (DUF937 family)